MHLIRNDRSGERYILGGTDDGGIAIWALEYVRNMRQRNIIHCIHQISQAPGAVYSVHCTSQVCSAGAAIQRKCWTSTRIVALYLRGWYYCCGIDGVPQNVGLNQPELARLSNWIDAGFILFLGHRLQ